MNSSTIDNTITKFKDLAIKHNEAAEKSDHRKANRIFDKLEDLFKEFKGEEVIQEKIIIALLHDKDIRVRVQGAMKALRIKKYVQEAVDILEEAERQTIFRILRVDAHMALRVWKEQGTFSG